MLFETSRKPFVFAEVQLLPLGIDLRPVAAEEIILALSKYSFRGDLRLGMSRNRCALRRARGRGDV